MEKYSINKVYGYIEIAGEEKTICNEDDIMNIIGACYNDDINKILLKSSDIVEDFFELKTGLAGRLLQKLVVYKFKAAFIIDKKYLKGRFAQLVQEENKKNQFCFVTDLQKAEEWFKNN